jgi:uncharacterized protein YcbX
MSIRIVDLHRYPVKGLSPEKLDRAILSKGDYFPGDRLFAVENGPAGFDPGKPEHQPKIKFLMLMRNESLARLTSRYLDETSTLVINEGDRELVRGDVATGEGRLAIEAFFRRFMPAELRGPPKVLTAPDGFRFTDSRSGFVSLINLASVEALGGVMDASIDPLRFRGNLHIDGLAPWAELDLVGQVLTTDAGVRLKIIKRIPRCAATEVNPATATRDLAIPKALMATYGHVDCGIYAEVLAGGTIVPGDRLAPEQPALALS